MRFDAILHGAKFKTDKQLFTDPQSGAKVKPSIFEFGDPKEYEKMSPDEKEKLTRKMMGVHKRWAGQKKIPLGD